MCVVLLVKFFVLATATAVILAYFYNLDAKILFFTSQCILFLLFSWRIVCAALNVRLFSQLLYQVISFTMPQERFLAKTGALSR